MMDRVYEQLVQKIPTAKDRVVNAVVWLGVVVASAAALILLRYLLGSDIATYFIALLLCVLFVMWGLIHTKNMRREYEYAFVGDEIRVERILNSSRKALTTAEMSKMMSFGRFTPQKKRDYDPYRVFSCYTGKTKELWYCVFMDRGKRSMLIFEPDETMLEMIREALPYQLRQAAFGAGEVKK